MDFLVVAAATAAAAVVDSVPGTFSMIIAVDVVEIAVISIMIYPNHRSTRSPGSIEVGP